MDEAEGRGDAEFGGVVVSGLAIIRSQLGELRLFYQPIRT